MLGEEKHAKHGALRRQGAFKGPVCSSKTLTNPKKNGKKSKRKEKKRQQSKG